MKRLQAEQKLARAGNEEDRGGHRLALDPVLPVQKTGRALLVQRVAIVPYRNLWSEIQNQFYFI